MKTKHIKERKLKLSIFHDVDACNPFEEFDGNAPLMFDSYAHSNEQDYSKGSIHEYVKEQATRGKILRHQKELERILELDFKMMRQNEFTTEDLINETLYEIGRANVEELAVTCELLKVKYLNYTSRGYSQGDSANVLIVLTDEFFNETGCKKRDSKKIIDGAKELFNAWAWGDVYGFSVIEVTTCKCCNNDEENVIDSCGGFYGDNFEENGMLEYLPEELHEELRNFDKSKIEY